MFQKNTINNDFYNDLGEDWYQGKNFIALLRAESKVRNPWVLQKIKENFLNENINILDVGCGGGFLSNFLAENKCNVTGLDLHVGALKVAQKYDKTQSVNYMAGNAESLPFSDGAFDVVCVLDFLEHVNDLDLVLSQCVRVTKPSGLIFFHTFNRNLLSRFFVIKGVEYFVKETPKNLHVHHLFIKPKELINKFSDFNCALKEIFGLNPKILSKSFLNLILKGEVDEFFEFKLGSGLQLGYLGYVKKG